jgi:hypothetical protein
MGNWHGDVAIKFLDMENLEDETTLEAFRLDVATFRCASFFLVFKCFFRFLWIQWSPWIRIREIRKFLGLPDPLVRGPVPDPSIIKQN